MRDIFLWLKMKELMLRCFISIFVGIEVLKIKSGFLRYIAGVIIFNLIVGSW